MEAAASVIGIVTAGVAIGKRINTIVKAWKNAPQEILALANEVSDLNLVLRTAEEALTERDACPSEADKIISVVQRAKVAFDELDELSARYSRIIGLKNAKKGRFVWIKEKTVVKTLHERVKQIRTEVVSLVAIRTLSITRSTQISINDLRKLVMTEFELNRKLLIPPSETTAENEKAAIVKPKAPSIRLPVYSPSLSGACPNNCSCTCHRGYNFRSANALLGALFFSYNASPSATAPCSERSCKRHESTCIQVAYFFPLWFLKYAIYLFISSTLAQGGPRLTLAVARVIPAAANSLEHVWLGNIDAVRVLFSSRVATPMDVDDMDGGSYLNYALRARKPAMTQFIFELPGTDPSIEDQFGESPIDVAWQLVLSKKVDPDFEYWLRARLADEDRLQSRQFTTLHKIICGLSPHSLVSDLLTSTALIDTKDSGGWTPLIWAAYCQNWDAMDLLLQFGADATIPNKKGQLALHFACREGLGGELSEDCLATISSLAAATTNINTKDTYGDTPIMYAAENDNDPRILEILHAAGASLEETDLTGHTALHLAIYFDNSRAAEVLVQLGAEIDRTSSSHTALMKSFISNAHGCIRTLLNLGADPTVVDLDGNSVLHIAAMHADAESLDLLRQDPAVKVLDPEARNSSGQTADQAFGSSRLLPADEEVDKCWDRLWGAVRAEWLLRTAADEEMAASWSSTEEGLMSHSAAPMEDPNVYYDAQEQLIDL